MIYFKPKSIIEAENLKQENKNSYFLAGGTQLNSFYARTISIDTLISLEDLSLGKIEHKTIGSMVKLQDILDNDRIHDGLKVSIKHIVNRNIRNIATIGGNIGSNKPSSDIIGTLIALKAVLECQIYGEKKMVNLLDWVKKPAGLILRVLIENSDRMIYQRRFSRTKNDIPILKAAIGYKVDKEKILDVVFAISCVSSHTIKLEKSSKFIENNRFSSIDKDELKRIAQSEVNPIDDKRASASYRRLLIDAVIEEFIDKDGNKSNT